MLSKIKVLLVKYRSFVAYSLAGVINTGIDFVVFALLISFDANIAVAQAIAYLSGLVSSYFLNKKVTFKNNTTSIRQIVLFLLVNGVTMTISATTVYCFSTLLGFHEYMAKLLVTPIVMLLNYAGLRYIVFNEQKSKPNESNNPKHRAV